MTSQALAPPINLSQGPHTLPPPVQLNVSAKPPLASTSDWRSVPITAVAKAWLKIGLKTLLSDLTTHWKTLSFLGAALSIFTPLISVLLLARISQSSFLVFAVLRKTAFWRIHLQSGGTHLTGMLQKSTSAGNPLHLHKTSLIPFQLSGKGVLWCSFMAILWRLILQH